jgi:hypothetical protein
MTDTELNVMAALAMIGLSSSPDEGIEDARRDRNAERVMHEGEEEVLSNVAHRRVTEPPRARTIPRKSPCTSVMPALSIATSVPVPIAMPTSA